MPKETTMSNPKMKMEGMSWAIFWEDEGTLNPSFHLTRAFVYVTHYRTKLILGDSNKMGNYGPKYFDMLIFKLAKFYFPDWIGFDEKRCSYNPEFADRILRMHKVAEWRLNKMFDDEI